nr:hypothetical protein [Tanacetum cinerariifolium]
MQTQTSNTLHNAIMEAGSKDRPPMLTPGNYIQWKSRINRYIDTKPNHELIHYCLTNPPYKLAWADKEVPISKGIDNDIYSTVDACLNACEMWKAIKRRANQDNSPRINRGTGYKNQRIGIVVGARETVGNVRNQKRVKDAAYHREKMLLYKQEEAGIQLNAEQADWRDDTDNELEDQELEAHYMYMAQIQEFSPDAADSGPIFDAEPLEEIDQNDDDNDLSNERELLASLIEKLKCEIDESKNRNKFLETSNKILVETLKDKELDKVIALENKVKVLDNIVHKTSQSVQTMNMLNNKCRMNFAKPEFLKKAQRANPRLYDIGCYNDNLALMLTPESDEVIRLEKESRSKLSDLIRPFEYDKLNNLYDLFVPQHEKSSEQKIFFRKIEIESYIC